MDFERLESSRRVFLMAAASGAGFSGIHCLPVSLTTATAHDVPHPEKVYTHFKAKSLSVDIAIAGGGLAGVCAALAAARNGRKVVLIQDRSRLGGNSSSEIRMHVCGANNQKELSRWRETGLIEELKLTEAASNPQRSFEMWDLLLYDKVLSEPNITLLLDTAVTGAHVEEGRIVAIKALSPLNEEQFTVEAKFFIDCTGDAGLAVAAGAEIMRGREGTTAFGESLAPAASDMKTMGNSLLFFARCHSTAMPFTAPTWARKFTETDFINRHIHSWEYGYWWIEWGGELDTIADNRKIRHELLRIVLGVWDYIKNSGQHPDSANWALDWVGMIPGKRENRRIRGPHIMTQNELEQAELYIDRVAYGGWPLDDHPPCGFDCSDEQPARQIRFTTPYNIPLGSLFSTNIPNLLMAGRNISASHVAFSSTRVMATCATMGQAAGTTAAFCVETKTIPRDITNDEQRIHTLQQHLLRDDQSLLHITNEDPVDLARIAHVSASAETPEGPASAVIDGFNRNVGDTNSHQWQAPMPSPWISLEWDKPQRISQVQLTLDTGLERPLFLSGENGALKNQIRGPQPECIADYVLEGRIDGHWTILAQQQNNYLRLVRHRFTPLSTTALRVQVHRTHGDTLARIFEIRAYT